MFQRLYIPKTPAFIACTAVLLLLASPAYSRPFTPGAYASAQRTAESAAAPFCTTVRQRYEYSCGAAALATLLIYHYESAVSEEEVFAAMLRKGDGEKIRSEGFSMLDMKMYLDDRGYDSAGYEVSLDRLAEIGLPGIVLISYRGLNHFVVLKGISRTDVLLGDPVLGIRTVPRATFDGIWNGVIFVIRSMPDTGSSSFNRLGEWEAGRGAGTAEWLGLTTSGKADAPISSEKGMMSRAGHAGITR